MLGTEVGLEEGRGNEEAGPQVLADEGVEDGARLRKGTGGACADERPGDWMDLWVAASDGDRGGTWGSAGWWIGSG